MKPLLSLAFEGIGLNNTVKALFTSPTLGLPVSALARSDVMTGLAKFGLLKGVPIYTSKISEIGENSVGKQILLRADKEGTSIVTDNVAPQPRQWEIQGYISAGSMTFGLGSGFLAYSNVILQPMLLTAIKDYIRYLRNSRAPFYFTTAEGEVVEALMVNYTMVEIPESENAVSIKLNLMEYITLSVEGKDYTIRNAPSIGSIFGNPGAITNTAAKSLTNALSLLI